MVLEVPDMIPDMNHTLQDYLRLAEAVRAQRLALRHSVRSASEVAGIVRDTWARIEKGRPVMELTYRAVEEALGWDRGSCEAILRGSDQEPERPEAPDLRRLEGMLPSLSPRQASAIEEIVALILQAGEDDAAQPPQRPEPRTIPPATMVARTFSHAEQPTSAERPPSVPPLPSGGGRPAREGAWTQQPYGRGHSKRG